MKIFSPHRRKMEARRRFGGREFRSKVKQAANYKRVLDPASLRAWQKMWASIGLGSKWARRSVIAVLLSGIYFLTLSHYFLIDEIEITGNQSVTTESIEAALHQGLDGRSFLIPNRHLLLLTENRANLALTERVPAIRRISEFNRSWPDRLKIEVQERSPGFVIKSHDQYFLIDDEGVVVSQLPEPGDLLVVEDQLLENFGTGDTLPNPKLAPFVVSMTSQWNGKISTPIVLGKIPSKESVDVQFQTQEGWSVLFDSSRSAAVQLTNLTVLLAKEIGSNRSRLAYIDLRLSRAYYCFKSTPCQEQASAPAEEESEPNEQ